MKLPVNNFEQHIYGPVRYKAIIRTNIDRGVKFI